MWTSVNAWRVSGGSAGPANVATAGSNPHNVSNRVVTIASLIDVEGQPVGQAFQPDRLDPGQAGKPDLRQGRPGSLPYMRRTLQYSLAAGLLAGTALLLTAEPPGRADDLPRIDPPAHKAYVETI